MPTKTATVRYVGPGLRFIARSGSGHELVLDDAEGDEGPRPAELLMAALAGCTAMDVRSILAKKRQDVTRYEVRVTGIQREQHPRAFEAIDVLHEVEGPALDAGAVSRAIELSATKYCAASATLSSGELTIRHRYSVRTGLGLLEGLVTVTGPGGSSTPGPETGPGVRSDRGERPRAQSLRSPSA
jgi:putative redox protein